MDFIFWIISPTRAPIRVNEIIIPKKMNRGSTVIFNIIFKLIPSGKALVLDLIDLIVSCIIKMR